MERIDEHLLLPASEALLDEDSIKRFRSRYRELFGANATQDPLYEAVSEGRRLAGMEHWLPLFEERMASLFDHLAKDDVVIIDQGALGAAEERLNDIADYHQQRGRIASEKKGSYRPLKPDALYLTRAEFDAGLAVMPAHRATGFASEEKAGTLDFGFRSARDFTPERGRGENVYEAAAKHLKSVAKGSRKSLVAAYSTGSARRIASILDEAGAPTALAESWQQALGLAAKNKTAVVVLPLETGFASDTLEVLTEADILGDRLVRRKKSARIPMRSSPNFRHCRAAIWWCISSTGSDVTSASNRSRSAKASMIASRWNMRAGTSCSFRSRTSTCSAATARPSWRSRSTDWAAKHGSAAAPSSRSGSPPSRAN